MIKVFKNRFITALSANAKKLCEGFSLMEMMIVLLIVAIIAAASAPMVSRKMMRNAGTQDSPWIFTGLDNNIAFNHDDAAVIIGASSLPTGTNTKFYVKSSDDDTKDQSQMLFDNGKNAVFMFANGGEGSFGDNGKVGITNVSPSKIPANSVLLGANQVVSTNAKQSVTIGHNTVNTGENAIAIGSKNDDNTEYNFKYETVEVTSEIIDEGTTVTLPPVTYENQSAVAATESAAQNKIKEELKKNSLFGDRLTFKFNNLTKTLVNNTQATGENSIAIGSGAQAKGKNSIAIGTGAVAKNDNELVLGNISNNLTVGNLTAASVSAGTFELSTFKTDKIVPKTTKGQITVKTENLPNYMGQTSVSYNVNKMLTLGDEQTIVYIPGHLAVDRNVMLGRGGSRSEVQLSGCYQWGSAKMTRFEREDAGHLRGANGNATKDWFNNVYNSWFSDRRLKNVGDKFVGGLEELKKLDLYNFTFKKDESKTPQVGVMAQDLQKVFPNAVWEGDDGYLRIRWDEMFYAVINAIKELDNKIETAFKNIKSNTDKIEKLQAQVDAQQKVIDDLTKRLEKLERKSK